MSAALCAIAQPSVSRAQEGRVFFNIPAQPADAALREFARQAGRQILFSFATTEGRSSSALRGRYTPSEAVVLLAAPLGLEIAYADARTIALRPAAAALLPDEPAVGAEPAPAGTAAVMAAAEPPALEEIVVTAQKRLEALQRVPLSIDAIDDEALLREGIHEVRELYRASTELEIDQITAQATVIGIRGMQQSGTAPTDDTLVAVHLDGAYLSSFWGLNGLLFDLERVEVLAGPQGTLYGRNTAAGAVNLITRRPERVFEASATVDVGSLGTMRLGGGASLPLSNSLAMRVAGQTVRRDALLSDGSGEDDQWGARVSGIWTPDAVSELTFTLDHASIGGTTPAATLYDLNEGARLADGSVPASVSDYLDNPTLRDPYDNVPYNTQRNLVPFGAVEQTNRGVMLQFSRRAGPVNATVQFSHREVEGVSRSATRTPTQFSGTLLPNAVTSDSLELRVDSAGDGSWQWVAGAFYIEAENLGWNATPLRDNSPDPVTGIDVPWCPCSSGYFPNSGNMRSWALFGQATWSPEALSRLRLTGGLRYTYDWKDATLGYWATTANGPQPIIAFGIPQMAPEVATLFAGIRDLAGGDNDRTWDGFQYRLAAEWELRPASMVYGYVATGYKSGGLTYGATPELEPEDLLAIEVGTKNRFQADSLELNAAAWWYDDTNLEVNVQRPLGFSFQLPNGTFQDAAPSTASAGRVRLAGASADLTWNLGAHDRLGLSFTYIYSSVLDGSEVTSGGLGRTVFNEGERLGDAPEWQVIGRYGRRIVLHDGSLLSPFLKFQWQSRKYDAGLHREQGYFPDNRSPVETAIPPRGILDFSLRYIPPSGTWDVTAYVNNVTDELDIRSLGYGANPANATTTYGHVTALLGEPRMFGLILTARFRP